MSVLTLNEVLDYWQELRGERIAPLRSEVDPRRIESALETAFILEKVAPEVIRFRIAGLQLNTMMGMEVRGMSPTTLFETEARKQVAQLFDGVFEGPDMIELTVVSDPDGHKPLTGQILVLPLRDDFGVMNRALGCMIVDGIPGRAPRRFRLTGTRTTRVAATLKPRPKKVPALPGLAEAPASYNAPVLKPLVGGGQTTPPRQRPKLRLIKSDDR